MMATIMIVNTSSANRPMIFLLDGKDDTVEDAADPEAHSTLFHTEVEWLQVGNTVYLPEEGDDEYITFVD